MHEARLKEAWLREENAAHMLGWDFSHLRGRYKEDTRLPWDYRTIVLAHLKSHTHLLDMGTGGGEFLLTLKYPHSLTTVTEAYPPLSLIHI